MKPKESTALPDCTRSVKPGTTPKPNCFLHAHVSGASEGDGDGDGDDDGEPAGDGMSRAATNTSAR